MSVKMYKLAGIVLFLSAVSFSAGLTLPDITTFIVNGTRANGGQFPYVVSIRVAGSHNCGGCILDKRWILTAAHCASDDFPKDILSVVAGTESQEEGGDQYSIEEKIPHPDYNGNLNINDIALFKLDRDIEFRKGFVEPIQLASENQLVPDGAKITVAGWGYTHYPSTQASKHLLYTHAAAVGREECQNRWTKKTVITREHFCIFNSHFHSGTCLGDSGSPYAYDNRVVGVHIFGDWCKLEKPSVATRVSAYLNWIAVQKASFP